jgi:hypothetical protein
VCKNKNKLICSSILFTYRYTDFDNVVGKPKTTPGHTQQQPTQGAGGGGDRPLQQPREGERQQQTVLA